jgi:hypothetical protein
VVVIVGIENLRIPCYRIQLVRIVRKCHHISKQVGLQKVDHFASPAVNHGLHHEKTESFHLFQLDGRRQCEFMSANHNLNQGWPWMGEGLREHWTDLPRSFYFESEHSRSISYLREVGIDQICCKVKHADGLHFKFDKGQRAITKG